jgi:hypothetical protein
MDFHITKIEPKYDASGKVNIIRFGLSFYEEGCEPFHDVMGYLYGSDGKVHPPSTYARRGQRTNVVMDAAWFLEDLEKLWRTHPELVEYSRLVVTPEVAFADRIPMKERVSISMEGLRDGV